MPTFLNSAIVFAASLCAAQLAQVQPRTTPTEPRPIVRRQEVREAAVPNPFVPPAADAPQEAAEEPVAAAATEQWCEILYLDGAPEKAVVVNQDGDYMPGVRQSDILWTFGQSKPAGTFVSYKGIFAPTNPATAQWEVRNIRPVSADEFQKVVDQESAE